MLVDVHCHLDHFSDNDIEEATKGIDIVVSNGVNREANLRVLEIASKFKKVKPALGIYPIEALKLSNKELDKEIEFIKKNKTKIFAVGEVGMDFKESEEREKQAEIFKKFIKLSIELDVPVIVHSRKAEKECIEILEELGAKKVIMHCFCGKMSLVDRIISNGWYLSIPTNVKFSTQFQETVKKVPIENLLCETDSPYLHPDKEFPNKPKNVLESYKKIAELKSKEFKEIEKIIGKNYSGLFED